MPLPLPANPDLDWLKKAAKKRLVALRANKPEARLHEAQGAVANAYGFKSGRTLKAHIETLNSSLRERDCVFDAARAGDIETIRRAFAGGSTRQLPIAMAAPFTRSPRSAAIRRLSCSPAIGKA